MAQTLLSCVFQYEYSLQWPTFSFHGWIAGVQSIPTCNIFLSKSFKSTDFTIFYKDFLPFFKKSLVFSRALLSSGIFGNFLEGFFAETLGKKYPEIFGLMAKTLHSAHVK